MAAETVLCLLLPPDRRLPAGAEGSWAVRAPGDPEGGRQLLRLRLGESMEEEVEEDTWRD